MKGQFVDRNGGNIVDFEIVFGRRLDASNKPKATICTIKGFVNGVEFFSESGWAYCSPVDRFLKEEGRKRSLRRAIRAISATMPLDKPQRTAIWTAYHTRPGGILDPEKGGR